MDWIELTDFRLDAVLGVLDDEQRRTQPLTIGLRLGLDLTEAGDTDDLTATVDYAAVQSHVATIAQRGQFRLLETMGLAICRLLLLPPAEGEGRALVREVELTLRKPTILDGATPGVTLHRTVDNVRRAHRDQKGIAVDVLVETPSAGVYRLIVPPGGRLKPSPGMGLEVIAGQAEADGRRIHRGERIAQSPDGAITNAVDHPLCMLAVSRPPWI